MKRHSFPEKSNCKNISKIAIKNYSSTRKGLNRIKSTFSRRFTAQNYAKESSHDGVKIPICDGESE